MKFKILKYDQCSHSSSSGNKFAREAMYSSMKTQPLAFFIHYLQLQRLYA